MWPVRRLSVQAGRLHRRLYHQRRAGVPAGCDRHPDAIAGGDYSQVGSGRTVYEIQEGETRTRTFYLPIGSNSTYITGQYETTAHARTPRP